MGLLRDITLLTGGMFISKLKENPVIRKAVNDGKKKLQTGVKNAASFVVNVIEEIEKEDKKQEKKES